MCSEGCFKSVWILLLRKTSHLMQGKLNSSASVHISLGCGWKVWVLWTGINFHRYCCSPRTHSVMWSLWLWGYFIRRANCRLVNFGVCSSAVKSCLLQSFCMSLYGVALWRLACPELQLLETALKRIWSLLYCSHRGLTHRTASMQRIYNPVSVRSVKLLHAAKLCPSALVQRAFFVATSFPGTFWGYNCCFGFRHLKVYCNSDDAVAGLIRRLGMMFLCVPGFQLSELELEEFVYVASTF